MTSNIERRLRRLEGLAKAEDEIQFVIEDDWRRSDDERLRLLGILDKPSRQFRVISVDFVSPGPQPSEPLPPDVSPWDSGNWQYEPKDKEPVLCGWGPPHGPQRPGSEWMRER